MVSFLKPWKVCWNLQPKLIEVGFKFTIITKKEPLFSPAKNTQLSKLESFSHISEFLVRFEIKKLLLNTSSILLPRMDEAKYFGVWTASCWQRLEILKLFSQWFCYRVVQCWSPKVVASTSGRFFSGCHHWPHIYCLSWLAWLISYSKILSFDVLRFPGRDHCKNFGNFGTLVDWRTKSAECQSWQSMKSA